MAKLLMWFAIGCFGLLCMFIVFYIAYKTIEYIFFRRKLLDITREAKKLMYPKRKRINE